MADTATNGTAAPSADLQALLERALAANRPTRSRYADWDAAIDRRAPIKFKFLGVVWKVKGFDFREMASMADPTTFIGLSDVEATTKVLDFIGSLVSDPAMWKKRIAAAKIALSTAMGGLQWLMIKDAGLPLEIADGDDPDPLDQSPPLSPPAVKNGRPSAGGSRKSASRTP